LVYYHNTKRCQNPVKTMDSIFYAFFLTSVPATCSIQLIFDLITLILLDEHHELWSPLSNFLHSPVSSSSFCPNILNYPQSVSIT